MFCNAPTPALAGDLLVKPGGWRHWLPIFRATSASTKSLVGILFERKSSTIIQIVQNLVAHPVLGKLDRPVLMPANSDPDAALMLRVKHGDSEAFAELVEKYKQPVI